MKTLAMNCGSSSLKYQLIDMENEDVLVKRLCEGIGIDGPLSTHTPVDDEKRKVEAAMSSHKEAIGLVMQTLVDLSHGVIRSMDEVSAIGHRVVHDGTCYNESVLVNGDVKKTTADCFDLAPLHNPTNPVGIEAYETAISDKPNVIVFGTASDISMPGKAYLYALPYEYYEKYKARRYSFHGTSHNFVAGGVTRKNGLDPKSAKVAMYHLGSGASVSTLIGGKRIDTSMGLIPPEGLIMDTRSGDVDPAIIQPTCEYEKLMVEEIIDVLNKKPGVPGLSNGISSDFRDIDDVANGGNYLAKVILGMYAPRVAKYVGAYATAVSGVDAIAFAAGIDESDKFMRKNICAYLGYLGVEIDDERNNVRGEERLISTDDSKVQACLLPTNEELAVARDALKLTK